MKRTPVSPRSAPERRDRHQLRLNRRALAVALVVLVGVIGIILMCLVYDGLLFGMMLAAFFPYVCLFTVDVVVLYVALLISNTRTTAPRPGTDTPSRESRGSWLAFAGLTTVVLAIVLVCTALVAPVIGNILKELWTHNPFF